jgi:antitoxin (DNA-binding transcriptional repressor) of toxin-antitoxin stability system
LRDVAGENCGFRDVVLTARDAESPWLAAQVYHGYNSHMEKATVSKLKDNLSAYLRKVRAGHAVVIYDRDVPIARLERIESTGRGADRLALLRAQGVTRPPVRPLSAAKLRASLSKPIRREARVVEALRLDRAEDR